MVRRIVTALLLASMCTLAAGAAEARSDQRIAFVVSRAGFGEIWTMTSDGGGHRRLSEPKPRVTDAAGAREPDWSPDGERIAYSYTGRAKRESGNDHELYVMRADGSSSRRLTRNRALDASATWSPDGRRLAFLRYTNWGDPDVRGTIVVLDVATGRERVLRAEPRPGPRSLITHLAWSPDGSEIALTLVTYGKDSAESEIRLMPADGGISRRLVADAGGAAWSPDGRRLAFQSGRDEFGRTCFHDCAWSPEIYVIDRDGTGLRRLTRNPAADGEPTWSTDGRWIAFVSDRSNKRGHAYEIYVMPAAGGLARRITRNAVWDRSPDWR